MRQEFRKLATPNFGDPDVYPLMKVGDDAVFAAIKASCRDVRTKLVADLADIESPEKIVSDFDTLMAKFFGSEASSARLRLNPIVTAMHGPGPRSAIPLAEPIYADDYPAAAARRDEQGQVAATYTVGIDGRVSGCSGAGATEALHAAACTAIVRRWRYVPALDAAGQRVPENRTKTVSFSIH